MIDQVDDAMRRFRAEQDPDEAAVDAAVRRALALSAERTPVAPSAHAPGRPRPIPFTRGRAALFVGAIAAVIVAAAIGIPFGGSQGHGGPQTAAAAQLEEVAQRILAQQPVKFPLGHYWYVRTAVWERWIARDGSGGGLPTSGDTQGDLSTRPGSLLGSLRSLITNPSLDSLPRDPKALRAYLERRQRRFPGPKSGSGLEANLFASLGVTATYLPSDPELLATLYRVMASLPGIRDGGAGTDALGRSGRIYYDVAWTPPYRWEALIDPRTGEVLQTRILQRSTVIERDTVLESGLVATLGERPDGTRVDTSDWAKH
jgi:hypothetical protein